MEKTKVMLDTSAYSAFLRGNADIARLVQESDEIYLNPVVLGELIAGFIQGGREKKNRETLKDFLSSSRVKVADLDDETSERYAAIITYLRTRETPIPTNDLWIAATAMQYGLKLLTTDAHYRNVPQVIVECCAV